MTSSAEGLSVAALAAPSQFLANDGYWPSTLASVAGRETPPEDASLDWFAIHVKPRHEWNVHKILTIKNVEALLPSYIARKRWSDRVKEVKVPLFPGYVFCKFNSAQRALILSTQGVFGIVRSGHDLAPIDAREIAALQLLMRAGLDSQPWPQLEIGEKIEIVNGPLTGCTGVLVQIKKRMKLLLSVTLLGRAVLVELDQAWVKSERTRSYCASGPSESARCSQFAIAR